MTSNLWNFTSRSFPTSGICNLRFAICDLRLLAALSLLALAGCGKKPAAPAAAGGPPGGFAVPVEVAAVEQRDWAVSASAVGSLVADEFVTIRNLGSGYIKDIPGIEGAKIEANQPVVLMDDEKLVFALQAAAAKHEEATSTLRRRQPLFNQKLITEAEIVEAQAAASASEAQWSLAKRMLADATIRAPIPGTLGRRYVSPGDYAEVGTKLFDLVKTDVLKLEFAVPENLLTKVAVGAKVRVTTAAYPGRDFTGVVDFIEPAIDASTRTIRLRARVANGDGALKPNLFVNVEIAVDTIANAFVIPEEAVIPSLGGNSVFVVEDGKAAARDIKIADRIPGKVATRVGFKTGEQVVTTGHQKLGPGAAVMPLPPGGMAELMKQKAAAAAAAAGGKSQAPSSKDQTNPKSEMPKTEEPKVEAPKKKVNEVVTPPVSAPPEETPEAKKPETTSLRSSEFGVRHSAFQAEAA